MEMNTLPSLSIDTIKASFSGNAIEETEFGVVTSTGSSGLNNDHWGLDNVSVLSVNDCSIPYTYDYDVIAGNPNNAIENVFVGTTTTYTVTYSNGTDGCTASTTVTIPPCVCPTGVVAGGGTYCAGNTSPNVDFNITKSKGATRFSCRHGNPF